MNKDWKSTLIGAALAVADLVVQFLSQPDFDWGSPANYIRPALLAFFGYVVADARKKQEGE
ncbi:MAG: hypothetical protein H7A48_14550 [Akkermansiaceae bacterium]|nr:hypothetical protein [Akkermansiaceae bacterium]